MSLFGKKSRPSILDMLGVSENFAVFELPLGGRGAGRRSDETHEQHSQRIADDVGVSKEALAAGKAEAEKASQDVERKFNITSDAERRLMDTVGLAMLSVGTGLIERAMEVGAIDAKAAVRCFEAACEKLVVTNDAARPLATEILAKVPEVPPAQPSKSDA
jgi:hypothetical protein